MRYQIGTIYHPSLVYSLEDPDQGADFAHHSINILLVHLDYLNLHFDR